MERAALYIRVSSQEQAMKGLSLPAQRADLEAYAKRNKMKVVGVYADEGISARKPAKKRGSLQRLLDDVRADKIDIVLFIKLDRWFRNVAEYYKVQEVLDAHHVDWKCTQEDYETATSSGRLKVNIMLSVAQDEADRCSDRIKFVFEQRRASGYSVSARTPLGYMLDKDKRVVKNPELEPEINKMFSVFLETASPTKTSRACPDLHLNSHKLTRILHSEAYAGNWNGTPTEPYITLEQFKQIQAMRKKSISKASRKTPVFGGIIRCAECGNRFSTHSYPKAHSISTDYHCHTHYNMYGCPNPRTIAESVLEKYLLAHIDEQLKAEIEKAEASTPISYESQRKKIRAKFARLSDLYINDMIDMANYKEQYDALQKELDSIPEDEPAKDASELVKVFSGDWKSVYQQLDFDSRRSFWLSTLDYIKVDINRNISFKFKY